MIVLTPGYWHRFGTKGQSDDIAQWECPICHRRTNTPAGEVRSTGVLVHAQRHDRCGFFDMVKLEGWEP